MGVNRVLFHGAEDFAIISTPIRPRDGFLKRKTTSPLI